MRRPPGSGSVYQNRRKETWVAELTWNGKRHYRSAPTRYEAHVALMELRRLRELERDEP